MAQVHHEAPTSGWVGMAMFGGVMMMVAGTFHAMAGLVGIFKDTSYWAVGSSQLVISMDYTAWGWLHLIVGALAIAAGAGILAGQAWARVAGVVLAFISALVNLAFLAAFPLWATLIIAIDVLVIYALVAHGEEITA